MLKVMFILANLTRQSQLIASTILKDRQNLQVRLQRERPCQEECPGGNNSS